MPDVTPTTDITDRTISNEGVRAILAGTPMAPYLDNFMLRAGQYGIDPNWALSYIRWENLFGTANAFSMAHNNIWDILCIKANPPYCRTPRNWGASDCNDPGNGYCYAVYPSMDVGLEAGFRLWQYYVTQGWRTWETSLAIALCGSLDCKDGPWVQGVIATGAENAAQWPYTAHPPQPPPTPAVSVAPLILMGALLLIAGSAVLLQGLTAQSKAVA